MTDVTGSVTPPAPQPTETPPATPPAAPSAAWHATFDEETRGWLQNRGLYEKSEKEALAAVLSTARNAEKKLGVPEDRRLTLPADRTAAGALDPIYAALGRPEAPEGYELKLPDDEAGQALTKTLAQAYHGAGLSKEQAAKVHASFEKEVTDFYTAQQTRESEANQAQWQALKTKWGNTFDVNTVIARETVKAVGATETEIAALETALGSAPAVVEFFARIGQKRGVEAPFLAGNSAYGSGYTTPEAAKARISELKNDPEWARKFNNNDTSVMQEYRSLVAIAAAGR